MALEDSFVNEVLPYVITGFLSLTIIINFIVNMKIRNVMNNKLTFTTFARMYTVLFIVLDFITSLFVFIPSAIVSSAGSWILTDYVCEAHGVIITWIYLVTFGLMTVRNIERLAKIRFPASYESKFESKGMLVAIFIVVWIIDLGVALVSLSDWTEIRYDYYHSACVPDLETNIYHVILLLGLGLGITSIIFLISNLVIYNTRETEGSNLHQSVSTEVKCITDFNSMTRNEESKTSKKSWVEEDFSKSKESSVLARPPSYNSWVDVPKQNSAASRGKGKTISWSVFRHAATTNFALSIFMLLFYTPYFALVCARAICGDCLYKSDVSITLLFIVLTFTIRPIICYQRLCRVMKDKEERRLRKRRRKTFTNIKKNESNTETVVNERKSSMDEGFEEEEDFGEFMDNIEETQEKTKPSSANDTTIIVVNKEGKAAHDKTTRNSGKQNTYKNSDTNITDESDDDNFFEDSDDEGNSADRKVKFLLGGAALTKNSKQDRSVTPAKDKKAGLGENADQPKDDVASGTNKQSNGDYKKSNSKSKARSDKTQSDPNEITLVVINKYSSKHKKDNDSENESKKKDTSLKSSDQDLQKNQHVASEPETSTKINDHHTTITRKTIIHEYHIENEDSTIDSNATKKQGHQTSKKDEKTKSSHEKETSKSRSTGSMEDYDKELHLPSKLIIASNSKNMLHKSNNHEEDILKEDEEFKSQSIKNVRYKSLDSSPNTEYHLGQEKRNRANNANPHIAMSPVDTTYDFTSHSSNILIAIDKTDTFTVDEETGKARSNNNRLTVQDNTTNDTNKSAGNSTHTVNSYRTQVSRRPNKNKTSNDHKDYNNEEQNKSSNVGQQEHNIILLGPTNISGQNSNNNGSDINHSSKRDTRGNGDKENETLTPIEAKHYYQDNHHTHTQNDNFTRSDKHTKSGHKKNADTKDFKMTKNAPSAGQQGTTKSVLSTGLVSSISQSHLTEDTKHLSEGESLKSKRRNIPMSINHATANEKHESYDSNVTNKDIKYNVEMGYNSGSRYDKAKTKDMPKSMNHIPLHDDRSFYPENSHPGAEGATTKSSTKDNLSGFSKYSGGPQSDGVDRKIIQAKELEDLPVVINSDDGLPSLEKRRSEGKEHRQRKILFQDDITDVLNHPTKQALKSKETPKHERDHTVNEIASKPREVIRFDPYSEDQPLKTIKLWGGLKSKLKVYNTVTKGDKFQALHGPGHD